MSLPTLYSARLVRDGGIDAMAALGEALREAVVGLAPQDQQSIRLVFAQIMAEIADQIINPAVRAFPELDTDDVTWATVVKTRAMRRAHGV